MMLLFLGRRELKTGLGLAGLHSFGRVITALRISIDASSSPSSKITSAEIIVIIVSQPAQRGEDFITV